MTCVMHYTIDFLDRQQWEQNRSGFEAKENSIVFFLTTLNLKLF